MTPEITRADVIEARAKRAWRNEQPPMTDAVAEWTWSAIDESERTCYRLWASRLPGDRRDG